MITDFEIDNFKGLSGLKLEDLKPVNIFFGPNNSGKSSLMESLFLNAAPLYFQAFFYVLNNRLQGTLPMNIQAILDYSRLLFSNFSKNDHLKYKFFSLLDGKTREVSCDLEQYNIGIKEASTNNPDFITSATTSVDVIHPDNSNENQVPNYTPGYYPPPVNGSNGNGKQKLPAIEAGRIVLGYKKENEKDEEMEMIFYVDGSTSKPDSYFITDIPAVLHPAFGHRTLDAGIKAYSESRKKGYHKNCLELVRTIFPEIKDIQLLTSTGVETPYLFIDHAKFGLIPLNTQGDGVRKIYHLATSMIKCFKGALFIDEIETSIHPAGLSVLFKWLITECREHNIQLFVTTHSLEAVDAILNAVEENKNDCMSFQLKNEQGKIKCKGIEGRVLYNIRYDMGLEVRE